MAKRNENFIFLCISISFTLFLIPRCVFIFQKYECVPPSFVLTNHVFIPFDTRATFTTDFNLKSQFTSGGWTNDQKAKKESKHKKEGGEGERKNNGRKKWKKKMSV